MRLKRAKALLISLSILLTFFFSNNFGLIDVEKTSIITAIALDKEQDEYILTAQVAVPEATDTNTENQKAQLSSKGKTVGEALKEMGDVSGWFPKLAFCNLIILGNSLANENVVNLLDYFAKTLRLQDSALVALSEKTAKELLSLSTPLDNISSFAIQKILLKASQFDNDVAPTDIKTFVSGYYSKNKSGYMPLIKVISADNGSGSEGQKSDNSSTNGGGSGASSSGDQKGQGANSQSNNLFDARTTALFKEGKFVGELSPTETLVFNAFSEKINGTSIAINNVPLNGKECNYLLNIMTDSHSLKVKAKDNGIDLEFNLSLFCKVSDVFTTNAEDSLSSNTPLPKPLIEKTERLLTENIISLVNKSISSGCDLLKIKEKLYRYNHSKYSLFKDNYLSKLKVKINVDVKGPR